MEKPELKILTFNVKGKLPFSLRLSETEIKRYIERSKFNWQIMDEGITPRLIARMDNPKVTIVLFFSGSVQFLNPESMEKANLLYESIMNDLRKYCHRLFEED